MEFEQYLYGYGARDAAWTKSRMHRPGRISRMILGVALALVCLGLSVAVFGPDKAVRTASVHGATGERAEAAVAPVTLVASQAAAASTGR